MDHQSLIDSLRDIIADECEIPRMSVDSETDFQELGMGPILADAIAARFLEATGITIKTNLLLGAEVSMERLESYIKSQRTPTIGKQSTMPNKTPSHSAAIPLAIAIQESPKTNAEILFLLPDGSGSAMSYATLPLISHDLTIHGLNSPFLRSADGLESVESVSAIWLPEIIKIQPHGPYKLGGWSAGGYYAFEVAKLLQQRGEEVDTIILIDTPCRTIYEALPNEVVQYLASANLMGNWDSGKAPQWLLNHFDSSIKAIEKYHPTAMSGPPSTRVFIVWAADPVFKKGEAEDTGIDLRPEVCKLMLVDRGVFDAKGWEVLFPGMSLASASTPGNHFTIMSPGNV